MFHRSKSRWIALAAALGVVAVALAGCSSRRERAAMASAASQPPPLVEEAEPAPPPVPTITSEEVPARLPCSPDTRAARFEIEGSPGWRCVDRDGVASGPFYTMFPDGSTEISGAFRAGALDGPWRRRFRNGNSAEVGGYVDGKKDGVWQLYNAAGGLLGDYQMALGTGIEKRWYLDGQLASERGFRDGVLDGPSTVYALGGATMYSATFRAGVLDGPRHVGAPGSMRLDDQWRDGTPTGIRKIWRREFLALELSFDEEGFLSGPFTAWRDRYSLRERGTYLRGDRHGVWRWYDRSRSVEREGNYFLGLRHGPWREWDGGRLRMRGRYVKGRPQGTFTFWNGAGRVIGTSQLSNGTGKMITFHSNGAPAAKTTMVRGRKHGPYVELNLHGRVVVQGAFREDLRHGRWLERDDAGRLLREAHYVEGKLDGVERRYAGGALASEARYAQGRRDGDYREVRPGKDPVQEVVTGHFTDDRKSGEWIFRDRNGDPSLVQHFKDGELHGTWLELVGEVTVVRGQYSRGRRAGTWSWFSLSGQTVRTATYDEP